MKKLTVTVLVTACILAGFYGCKKETHNDAAEFIAGIAQLQSDNQPVKHMITVSANAGCIIMGHNTRLVFKPYAFKDAGNNIVTGNVQIVFSEIYTKGQMLLSGKTTMAANGILLSGGEAYLNATQSGAQLSIIPGQANIMFRATSFSQPMILFSGVTNPADSTIVWVPGDSIPNPIANNNCAICSCSSATVYIDSVNVNVCDSTYNYPFKTMGWINCDYFMSSTYTNLTSFTMKIPSGYNANNTQVFVVFRNINMVANAYNTQSGGLFTLSNWFAYWHSVPVI